MNKRVQMILVSAFVIACICSYVVYHLVNNMAYARPRTMRVITAASDIKLGSVLRDSDLNSVEIGLPLPAGAIVHREELVGRGVISNLYQGEPILQSRLAAVGAGGGLAATIPAGMRACAIKVDEVVGVAGFVTAGMRVDVLISGNPPGTENSNQGPKVKTLLQNIQVLSAGTDIQKDGEGKPQQVQVVNVLVTPEQAEQLSLASNQTKIQLVLRNPLDTQIAQPPGTAVASLYADKNTRIAAPKTRSTAVVVPKAAPEVYVVQMFNGSKQSEAKFGSGKEKQ